MTTIVIPKSKEHREKLKLKKCAFPGCNVHEKMTGKGKFCKIHRDRKYRKVIDADKIINKKKKAELNSLNQIIQHKNTHSTEVIMKCHLEGCEKEFTITIFPGTFVYPKYCQDHRSEYKRQRFIDERQNQN